MMNFDIMKAVYIVSMPDGSKWSVPVSLIANNHAIAHSDEFDGDVDRSLREGTIPLFEGDFFEVEKWAENNMAWSEVRDKAKMYKRSCNLDYEYGWVNGEKQIVTLG